MPVQVPIPVLETPRLVLRGHRVSDLDDSFAMWSSPEVMRIHGRPLSREEVWARLLRYIGHWAVHDYGLWPIRERATDRVAGEAGIADSRRDFTSSVAGAPEAAWVVAPWAHGRCSAAEAMTAVLAWSAAAYPRTVCIIAPDNAPSLRVAARLGYREIGRADFKGSPI